MAADFLKPNYCTAELVLLIHLKSIIAKRLRWLMKGFITVGSHSIPTI